MKGHEYIFDKDRQNSFDLEELHGDENVLNSRIIEEAFQFILRDYKPHHKYVIFGLCTKTRPYNQSSKWRLLNNCFGNYCDLIICSNGGIIPMEYANCFPFLEYDAPHVGTKFDSLYKEVFLRRLLKFLAEFKYEKIIFNFVPETRNYEAVADLDMGICIPNEDTFANSFGYLGVSMKRFQVCRQSIFLDIEKFLGVHSDYLHRLINKYEDCIPMEDAMAELSNSLPKDVGFTFSSLCKKLKEIAPKYSDCYIQKTLKGSIDNISVKELKTHQKYFHKQEDLIYVIGSTYKRNQLF